MGLARVSTAILALRNNPETATVKSVATLSTARVSPPGGASPGRASAELHQAMAGRLPGRGAARADRARPETVGCPQHGARRGAAVGGDPDHRPSDGIDLPPLCYRFGRGSPGDSGTAGTIWLRRPWWRSAKRVELLAGSV